MEIWKAIPGYEGYEASSLGKIRSIKFGKFKELKPVIGNSGYRQTILCSKGKRKKFFIHQLIAMTFLGHVPDGRKSVVDHFNCNLLDNRLENLRIVTVRKNLSKERTIKSGLPTGVTEYKRKIKPNKYRAIIEINGEKKHLGYFLTPKEASNAYQIALKTNQN